MDITNKKVDDFLTKEGFSNPQFTYRVKNKLKNPSIFQKNDN